MTNNELSRKVLNILHGRTEAIKFRDLVEAIGLDARTVYKNLFYLEEHEYIQLSTSYPSEAVYPLIHLIRLRAKGKDLVKVSEKMDKAFPLSDTARDHAPHIPPESTKLTYKQVLSRLMEETDVADLQDKERKKWLKKTKEMQGHPLASERIKLS